MKDGDLQRSSVLQTDRPGVSTTLALTSLNIAFQSPLPPEGMWSGIEDANAAFRSIFAPPVPARLPEVLVS